MCAQVAVPAGCATSFDTPGSPGYLAPIFQGRDRMSKPGPSSEDPPEPAAQVRYPDDLQRHRAVRGQAPRRRLHRLPHPGHAIPRCPPWSGTPAPLPCAPRRLRKGTSNSTMDRQVAAFSEVSGPPVVVFQDLDSPSVAATFGEVMCSVYQTFGAVGLVTSGTGRDLDQVRDLGFPAFTNGAIASHGYNHMVDLGRTVHVGGIAIFPGDLLHGGLQRRRRHTRRYRQRGRPYLRGVRRRRAGHPRLSEDRQPDAGRSG